MNDHSDPCDDVIGMFAFSEVLSLLTGINFYKVLKDHLNELKGLSFYLSGKKAELREEGFSENTISTIITLNLISSYSLWYGFSRAKVHSKIPSNSLRARMSESVDRGGTVAEKIDGYTAGVIIPTNMNKKDETSIISLKRLINSISLWKRLAGIWIVGNLPNQEISSFNKFHKVEVINVENDRGPASARNLGIERALKADSDLIIFMDDDVVNPIDSSFESLCDIAVLGNDIYTPKIQSYGDTCYDLFHDIDGTLNGVYESQSNLSSLVYGTTCVMICPSNILREGLRFDENFPLAAGEDIDFCIRAKNKGHKILPADHVIVQHNYGYNHNDESLMKFISRFVRYGEGNSIIRERDPDYFNSLTNATPRPTQSKIHRNINVPEIIKSLSNIVDRYIK